MAYQLGDVILDDHYNDFATQINSVWSTGSGATGYGQTNSVSAVAAGNVITATQWSTLLARISSAASHQGTTLTAITPPTTGNTVSAFTALQSNITAITNSRANAAASGTDITTGGVGQRTTSWTASVTMTYTITFASADAARYFFNAGGQIRISRSRSVGTAHEKNTEWAALCTAAGTTVIGNGAAAATIAGTSYNAGTTKIGGSGTVNTLSTALGYHSLTTSDQVAFRQYSATSPYTTNYLDVLIREDATGAVLTVTVRFIDAAADDSIPAALDVVDGTLQTNLVLRPPSTTYITNTWGTPTISVSVSGS